MSYISPNVHRTRFGLTTPHNIEYKANVLAYYLT